MKHKIAIGLGGFSTLWFLAIRCYKFFSKPKYISSIIQMVGNTPMIKINCLSESTGCLILAKMEFQNIGQSSKDRIALQMINEAEQRGDIIPFSGCTLVEGTVGRYLETKHSTGISLCIIAKAKGYNCHIVMPGNMYNKRRPSNRKISNIRITWSSY